MTTEMKRNASWINDAAGRVIRYVGTETAASGSYPINSNWQVQMADAAYLNALEARVEKLEAALRLWEECGVPDKVSLYDEEGVEGWRWTAPDGAEWIEMGDWREEPPMPPFARTALEE